MINHFEVKCLNDQSQHILYTISYYKTTFLKKFSSVITPSAISKFSKTSTPRCQRLSRRLNRKPCEPKRIYILANYGYRPLSIAALSTLSISAIVCRFCNHTKSAANVKKLVTRFHRSRLRRFFSSTLVALTAEPINSVYFLFD